LLLSLAMPHKHERGAEQSRAVLQVREGTPRGTHVVRAAVELDLLSYRVRRDKRVKTSASRDAALARDAALEQRAPEPITQRFVLTVARLGHHDTLAARRFIAEGVLASEPVEKRRQGRRRLIEYLSTYLW